MTTTVRTRDSTPEGNATAATLIEVPVEGRPFDELLAEASARTDRVRRPTRAMASRFVMATGLRAAPEPFARWFAPAVYGPRFLHAVVSNIPGPTIPMTFAGVPLHTAYPILPLVPGTPLAMGAVSWNGLLGVGLAIGKHVTASALANHLYKTLSRLRPTPRWKG
ncbi:WS/DGAT domain-containing protein [Kribbella sp. NPDC055110]